METIQIPYGSERVTFSNASGRSDGAPVFVWAGTPNAVENITVSLARAYKARDSILDGKPLQDMNEHELYAACDGILTTYEDVIETAFGPMAAHDLEEWLTGSAIVDSVEMVLALSPVVEWIAAKSTEVYGYAPFDGD